MSLWWSTPHLPLRLVLPPWITQLSVPSLNFSGVFIKLISYLGRLAHSSLGAVEADPKVPYSYVFTSVWAVVKQNGLGENIREKQ